MFSMNELRDVLWVFRLRDSILYYFIFQWVETHVLFIYLNG